MTGFHEEPFHNRESPCACDSSLAGRLEQQVSMSQGISPLEVYRGEEVCKNQRQKIMQCRRASERGGAWWLRAKTLGAQ